MLNKCLCFSNGFSKPLLPFSVMHTFDIKTAVFDMRHSILCPAAGVIVAQYHNLMYSFGNQLAGIVHI